MSTSPPALLHPRLGRNFYARDPVQVAQDLVGSYLVRLTHEGIRVGRIVETEAYRGAGDLASHAYNRKTARNFPMFGSPGHAYVYFIYGMHWMFNISAHPEGSPGAILIRALEPLEGISLMMHCRANQSERQLTNGPAKLAQAMSIDGSMNGLDLCSSDTLYLTQEHLEKDEALATGPRIRVPGDETAKTRPWRFWLAGNPFVST